ncbi:MAG: glycoside hydrolase family 95 protein, partial [Planctomycetota bacterium]
MRDFAGFLVVLACASTASAAFAGGDLVIWDNRPAAKWDVAYPVGNGRIGAMPFGGFPKEKVLINEETIWHRVDRMVMPDDSFQHLEKIRELEAGGDYQAADRYFEKHIQNGKSPTSYQLLGWLGIEYLDAGALKGVRRELDLKTGVARNVYTLEDGTTITQEVFVSAPDDAVAVAISASADIGVKVSLNGGVIERGDIVKTGAASGKNATRYVGRVRVLPAGKVKAVGNAFEVRGARELTIYLTAATDFDRRDSEAKLPDGWQRKPLRDMDRLTAKTPEAVEKAAIEDHGSYFGRLDVDFGRTPDDVLAKPTR